MLRKLNRKNKILIALFILFVFLLGLLFFYGVGQIMRNQKVAYPVTEGSLLYDQDYQFITLDQEGIVKKSWTGKYYLEVESRNKKYDLGNDTLVYQKNDYKMNLIGTAYQVHLDGTVNFIEGNTTLVRNGEASFYKINDRKYLLVATKIQSDLENFNTSNYLIVQLDKSGNALLLNHELNVKTIHPFILSTTDYTFDVANEKLIVQETEIDLKKINGSSNRYKKEEVMVTPSTPPPSTNDGNQNNNNQNSGNNNQNGNTVIPNNPSVDHPEKPLTIFKKASLGIIQPNATSMKINYSVTDVKNEYASIFILVNDGIETKRIELNKEANSYQLLGLKPDHEYTISFGNISVNALNYTEESITDVVKIKTKKPNYQLIITKVTSKRIYFNLKMDQLYGIESGNLVLYSDDEKMNQLPIEVRTALEEDGWTSSMEVTNLGLEIVLKIEDAIYNGTIAELEVQTKYINN